MCRVLSSIINIWPVASTPQLFSHFLLITTLLLRPISMVMHVCLSSRCLLPFSSPPICSRCVELQLRASVMGDPFLLGCSVPVASTCLIHIYSYFNEVAGCVRRRFGYEPRTRAFIATRALSNLLFIFFWTSAIVVTRFLPESPTPFRTYVMIVLWCTHVCRVCLSVRSWYLGLDDEADFSQTILATWSHYDDLYPPTTWLRYAQYVAVLVTLLAALTTLRYIVLSRGRALLTSFQSTSVPLIEAQTPLDVFLYSFE